MAQVDNSKDSKRIVIDLAMTVEEARKVIWQGSGPREPMGNLIDSNQIGYRDLAWAVDKAYNPQVRSAAITLLANWLGKPDTLETTRRFGPKVIEASHYLEDREFDGMFKFTYYAAGLSFLVFILLSNILQFLGRPNSIPLPLFIGVNLLAFVAVSLWILRQIRRGFYQWKYSRQGRLGEDKVVESLRTALDNQWTIIRNLQLPDGRKDDADILLIGPGGVWAVEVKAFKENTRIYNRTLEIQVKGKWQRTDSNPIKQVTDNAKRLNAYLEKQGIQRWVERAIALSEPQAISNFESSEIPVWLPSTIEDKVASLTTRYLPTNDEIERSSQLLTRLAQEQLAVEEAKYKKR